MTKSEAVTGENTEAQAVDARRALYEDVGDRIRTIRKQRGILQTACAKDAAIDLSSLVRIETGKQNLSLDTLARIAISLGVTMDALVMGVVPDPNLVQPRSRDGLSSGST